MKMKKFLLSVLLLCFYVTCVIAKTTYIPTYYSQIEITENGVSQCDSSITREISMFANDERFTITVLHDSVTAERIKAIKRMKAASGWALAAGVMGGVSAGLNPLRNGRDAVTYMNSMNTIASSSMLRIAAIEELEELKHVSISIIITNNSDREMTINDMNRGLIWYVRPHEYLNLDVGNPEINKLRIAYNDDCKDQQVSYVTVQTANFLSKEELAYEDDKIWIIPIYDDYNYLAKYLVIDKTSFIEANMSIEQGKAFINEQKAMKKR